MRDPRQALLQEVRERLQRLDDAYAAAMSFYSWAALNMEPSHFFAMIHKVRVGCDAPGANFELGA
jgi:hypothetical protein